MVYGKNIFSHLPDHVVPLDIPAFTRGSIIELRVEIFITDQYVEYNIGNSDRNIGLAFLGVENIKKISDWTQQYPECKDPESRKNDLFLKIVSNCMSGGSEEEMHKNLNNIVRNIAREVVIEK